MAWNLTGPKTVQFDGMPETVTVTDMLGTKNIRNTTDGVLTIEVGPYPIYIKPTP